MNEHLGNERYVTQAPDGKLGFELFKGLWVSRIPMYDKGGDAQLFDDARINWLDALCGGFKDKNILELGPLEGGHTYMMSRAGAKHVLSIEGNTLSYLKCLVVQSAFKLNRVDFELGDFTKYLDTTAEKFDFVLASGVLYHMTDPVKLLWDLSRISNSIGIWTHYYDPEVTIGSNFDHTPHVQRVGGRDIVSYTHKYGEALKIETFCGGSASTSTWLTRESLLGLLEDLGFTVTVGHETKSHQNGPCILLYLSREL